MRISAPRDKVWEAIIRPELVQRYFYNADMKADWRLGGEVVYTGVWEGEPFEERGRIIEFEPGHAVTIDFPETCGLVNYTLIDIGAPSFLNFLGDVMTEVTVTQSGVSNAKERRASERDWHQVLKGLKAILE